MSQVLSGACGGKLNERTELANVRGRPSSSRLLTREA